MQIRSVSCAQRYMGIHTHAASSPRPGSDLPLSQIRLVAHSHSHSHIFALAWSKLSVGWFILTYCQSKYKELSTMYTPVGIFKTLLIKITVILKSWPY